MSITNKFYPFDGDFNLTMGTSPMKDNDTIVYVDEAYQTEVALRRRLLQDDHDYYYQSLSSQDVAAWEAVSKIISHLCFLEPNSFILKKDGERGVFINKKLGEEHTFIFGDTSSLPTPPVDWIGRQIQEDLILLDAHGDVVEGQLCFPGGWALSEKIGKQFINVHAPLPGITQPMIHSANKLIERLPLSRPVARNNWGIRLGDQLDLSSKHSEAYKKRLETEQLTLDNIGHKLFLRVEHQTLTRLEKSGSILFTIHTYHSALAEEALVPGRKSSMLKYLQTTPPELIVYKQMSSFYDQLIEWLKA